MSWPIGQSTVGFGAERSRPAEVQLRQQPFQILRILVERQGKIVTREEIRPILWPNDTVVEFDRSINVAMAILRKALADDADHPKYIETLTGRGYRLISPLEWQQSSTAARNLLELQAETLPGDNNKVVAIVSGNTVADHGRRTIDRSCSIAQQT